MGSRPEIGWRRSERQLPYYQLIDFLIRNLIAGMSRGLSSELSSLRGCRPAIKPLLPDLLVSNKRGVTLID